LKYLKYGRDYHPDLVMFGIFTADYYRTPLSFYRFANYTFALLRLAAYRTFVPQPHEAYYKRWDPVIERILTTLVDTAEQDGAKVLFLFIPRGDQFASDAQLENRCCERGRLAATWQRLAETHPGRVEAIDLLDELPKRYSRKTVYDKMSILLGGQPIGHFTPFGNHAVAETIAAHLGRNAGDALARQ
jgi:hypothetical protein